MIAQNQLQYNKKKLLKTIKQQILLEKIIFIVIPSFMLNQKKKRELQLPEAIKKINEEYTRNSDRIPQSQILSQFSTDQRKSLTEFFTQRIFNKESYVKHSSHSMHNHSSSKDKNNRLPNQQKNFSKQFLDKKIENQLLPIQKQRSKQKYNYACKTQSTYSLNQNADQGLSKDRRKFKLYCQVKKKKNPEKKSEYEKQTQRFAVSSTNSQSWIKNSFFSRNSQRNDSMSTHKSKQKSLKRKININEKIKIIKSKQKQKSSIGQTQIYSLNTINFQHKYHRLVKNDQLPKKQKKSPEKKHSTLNIKGSLIVPIFDTEKEIQSKIVIEKFQSSSISSSKEPKQPESQTQSLNHQKPVYFCVENKILPQDSQIIEQATKKLSEIRQEKNEDTISRSIKTICRNSIDQSKSKDTDQTSMHLSINSIYKDHRISYGCILETTQLRQSSGLKKQIESSLSELQKTRQKIDIKKFEGLKKITELQSSISEVEYNMSTIQKIEFHIELINTLSNFVYKSTQLDYLMDDWDKLNFLIYKKFYLERMKILNFLKKYPIKNPFCIKRGSIETKQVLKALRENEGEIKRIKSSLETENSVIKKNLEVFYNQFSKEQHGEKINLLEYDNFSHWIYKQLWDEIQLLSYSQSLNQRQLDDRICKSLQAGFLISELNGNYVTPFEDAEIASRHNRQKIYIDDNLKAFERYVLNKKK